MPLADYLSYVAGLLLAVLLPCAAAAQDTQSFRIDEKIGQVVPLDLVFLDEEGEKVSLRQLTDKPVLISLVYLSCSSTCPLLLGNLAAALGATHAAPQDYRVVTLSFDDRDTPGLASEKKRNYLKAAGRSFPGASWRFLTGSRENIDRFAEAVGFPFRKEKSGFSHAKALIFLSPGGAVTRYLYGTSYSPFNIKMALSEASAKSNYFSADRLSFFCFSYDPGENTYVFNIARAFTAVLIVLMTSSVAFILLSRRRGGEK
jgi:protein SCO1